MSTSDYTTRQIENFYKKINCSDDHPLGCHEWIAGKTHDGYGGFAVNGKTLKAHRVSYELAYGTIPDGLFILHDCDNPACCDPNHLRVGTNADNVRDREERGRGNPPYFKGEQHGRAKLTVTQVREIRSRYKLHDQNHGSAALAKEFGVSQTTISQIANGQRWKEPLDGTDQIG